MTLVAENEQSASPDPLIELLVENERLSTRLRTERYKARAEGEALKKELNQIRQAFASQESLPD
jgi:hypothetical protein